MQELLDRYGALLQEVDHWFAGCLQSHGNVISCGRGCSACCRGLFDITLLDALFLRRGFDCLPEHLQRSVNLKSSTRLEVLSHQWPAFSSPWLLNHIPEDRWDDMMPEDDDTPCPLLSEEGVCLVYENRPMTCRLNGIPLMDISGEELFDEWCTMNFTDCDPMQIVDMRHPFNELFAQELLLFHELTKIVFGRQISEVDTIIPAALFIEAETLAGLLAGQTSSHDNR